MISSFRAVLNRTIFVLFLSGSAACLAQQYAEPPAVPATTLYADYPVHIHIFGVHWNRINQGYEGYGRADIVGVKPQGVDYTFSCTEPFLHNEQKAEFYQAKWKKQDQRLEILMQKVGTNHLQKCELKTSLKPETYGKYVPAAPAPITPPVTPAATPPQR